MQLGDSVDHADDAREARVREGLRHLHLHLWVPPWAIVPSPKRVGMLPPACSESLNMKRDRHTPPQVLPTHPPWS